MKSKIEHIENISYLSYYNTFGNVKELHVFENDVFLYKCVYKYNKNILNICSGFVTYDRPAKPI